MATSQDSSLTKMKVWSFLYEEGYQKCSVRT